MDNRKEFIDIICPSCNTEVQIGYADMVGESQDKILEAVLDSIKHMGAVIVGARNEEFSREELLYLLGERNEFQKDKK